jgi:cob(I)alamin adenosyltransferase
MPAEKDRLTRIYTRTGDRGSTRLVGGQAISKSSVRLEAYGTVDELSSVLGIVRALNRARLQRESAGSTGSVPDPVPDLAAECEAWLRQIQNELFHVGADLATLAGDRWQGMRIVGAREAARLEAEMDRHNQDLGPLREFILPGGGLLGAHLHLARTVCRRAERHVSRLLEEEGAGGEALVYLNRLSDYLFVLARRMARATGEAEEMWDRDA